MALAFTIHPFLQSETVQWHCGPPSVCLLQLPFGGAHNGGKEFWAFVDYGGAGLTAISVYRNEM